MLYRFNFVFICLFFFSPVLSTESFDLGNNDLEWAYKLLEDFWISDKPSLNFDEALRNPIIRIGVAIRNAELPVAQAHLARLKKWWQDCLNKLKIEDPEEAKVLIRKLYGYDIIEAAQKIFNGRPDQQKPFSIEDVPGGIPNIARFKFIDFPSRVLIFAFNNDLKKTVFELDNLLGDVFENSFDLQFFIPPEMKYGLRTLLKTIAKVDSTAAYLFYATAFCRILSDIQSKMIFDMGYHGPDEKSFKKYPYIYPVSQKAFLCNMALFLSNVIFGKYYLNDEEYRDSIDSFWKIIDNIPDEDWWQFRELTKYVGEMAAQMAWTLEGISMGRYLKGLKYNSLSDRAFGLAKDFRDVVAQQLTQDPVLVSDEGIPFRTSWYKQRMQDDPQDGPKCKSITIQYPSELIKQYDEMEAIRIEQGHLLKCGTGQGYVSLLS